MVSDVPEVDNFWIYAFCKSLKYNFNVQIEPQYVRDELSSFILNMSKN